MEVNINYLCELFLLLGDLNIHINKKDDHETFTVLNTLERFGL